MFATNLCLSKGGLGIVNTNLYIAVKSVRNELLFGGKETWSGSDASKPEVAIFFAGKVWALQSETLPKGFDLTKAVVVSFEGDKVRFFDFQTMSGGYYERIRLTTNVIPGSSLGRSSQRREPGQQSSPGFTRIR